MEDSKGKVSIGHVLKAFQLVLPLHIYLYFVMPVHLLSIFNRHLKRISSRIYSSRIHCFGILLTHKLDITEALQRKI